MPAAGPDLTGKVAIVTGAAQGVGRAIAMALARAGAQVAVIDLNGDGATEVAGELGDVGPSGLGITCDVSDRAQVRAAVEQTVAAFSGVDIVVNNAQDLREVQKSFLETDDEHLKRNLHSGLFGTYYFLQESYQQLKERRGSVVNIGSAAGVSGMAGFFSYAATKEAIRATTRVVAHEWGPDGIRVNTICPAAYDTPAMKIFIASLSEEQLAGMKASIPIGRLGTADDIASVALFLVSEAAGYVTGHTIMVDGGTSMDAGR